MARTDGENLPTSDEVTNVPLPGEWVQDSYNGFTGKIVYTNYKDKISVVRDVTDEPPTFTVSVADEDEQTFGSMKTAYRYTIGAMLQHSEEAKDDAS